MSTLTEIPNETLERVTGGNAPQAGNSLQHIGSLRNVPGGTSQDTGGGGGGGRPPYPGNSRPVKPAL